MNLKERIDAFVELGLFLNQFSGDGGPKTNHRLNPLYYNEFANLLANISTENPWFTTEHVQSSIKGICKFLIPEKIRPWAQSYPVSEKNTNRKVAVVMAGNIPMAGFHDMLCVLLSGHEFVGKLSSKDDQLLNCIKKLLVQIEPKFGQLIRFRTGRLNEGHEFYAVIATGSNNSARYFEAYFKNYPNIIRKNRNSVAILSGNESSEDLKALGNDVFLYFGLGCRNISKLYIPENYNIKGLFDFWTAYAPIINNSKYNNNYIYQRSILLMNQIPHFDGGFVLLHENEGTASPIGVVYYEYYSEIKVLEQKLKSGSDLIQCVVGPHFKNAIPYGKSQEPELWDYADNVDTMQFLIQL